jgi:hypothetical protein
MYHSPYHVIENFSCEMTSHEVPLFAVYDTLAGRAVIHKILNDNTPPIVPHD